MKKLLSIAFLTTFLLSSNLTNSQEKKEDFKILPKDRLSLYVEAVTLNFETIGWTVDSYYKISRRLSFSSWNRLNIDRRPQLFSNYFISSNMFNYKIIKDKDFMIVSGGYEYFINTETSKGSNNFIAKVRVKLF